MPDSRLKASVIISTHNGATRILKTLFSLTKQTMKDFEIIVVDNASTDNTKEVVQGAKKDIACLQYVFEPNLGISAARNKGFQISKGEVILFMDDDEIASPGWVHEHVKVYGSNKNIDAIGGRIILKWTSLRPGWLPRKINRRMGCFNLGVHARPMIFPEYPFGGNMSFRRNIFKQLKGFSLTFGIKGCGLMGNEEKEIFFRLNQLNPRHIVQYSPEAYVHHTINAKRLSQKNIIMRNFYQGVSDVLFTELTESPRRSRIRWLKRSLRGYVSVFQTFFPIFKFRIKKKETKLFMMQISCAYWLGYARECLKFCLINKNNKK